jgi:Mor family transcriptional regulator
MTRGEISALIGEDATQILIREYGGIRVYVPETVMPESNIAKLIGMEKAQLLAKAFPATSIDLPVDMSQWKSTRNDRIKKEYQAGKSGAGLAREYGVTQRQIWRIIHGR